MRQILHKYGAKLMIFNVQALNDIGARGIVARLRILIAVTVGR